MSKQIVIGEANGRKVSFDLDILLRTRLLIQANSGKGKSWLLRRIAEQMSGHVQVIIIDPEGEFATLREKYDYALIGKGGDGAAHPRIAALTAQRLLEVRASAVCDLYEMKPSERHAYVRLFLDALIDAPKNLWHPLVVILDEAHVYCPEKGAGESEAAESVISLATRGRKRGYCLIPATQRLGKFRKDAAAEMLNVAIGGTFIDIDRKRAADALGVYGAEQHEFFDEIRLLERGNFYMLGPAVSDQRILVKVAGVDTTHPEAGSAKHSAGPPPPPEKIKALLPKLADLPQEAEQKAKTEAELRTEVRSLKAQLAAKPKPEATAADPKAIERAIKAATEPLRKQIERMQSMVKDVAGHFYKANVKLGEIASIELPKMEPPPLPVPHVVAPPRPVKPLPISSNGSGDLSGPEQNILRQLAEMEVLGINRPEKSQLALMSGYTNYRSGGFSEPLAKLIQRGLIASPSTGLVAITDSGREIADPSDSPLTSDELHSRLCEKLGPVEGKILREIIAAHPDSLNKDELGAKLGYTNPRSGGFSEPIGRLRSLSIIEYPQRGTVRAADWLFLETA